MDESDQPSLTEFLLDLSDSEELYERFWQDRDALISERGLESYRDLLVREPADADIQGLRDAVRAEVTGRRGQPPDAGRKPLDECIIYGIRPPPPPPPPPPH